MKVIYSDTNIIVIEKPIGLDSEHQVPEELKKTYEGDIFTLHRLDVNVSGVMVYARNKHTAASLSKAIQENKMIKEYKAMIHGIIEEEGILQDLLF